MLSNHDVDRTSPGTAGPTPRSPAPAAVFDSFPADLALGTRRARAAALLTLALPGSVYVYQGEELGLWEVEDIPDELRQDPIWHRTGGADPGRDGCRVPLPWSGARSRRSASRPPGAASEPWLPQPAEWRDLTVEAENGERRLDARAVPRARCASAAPSPRSATAR